MAHEYPHQYQGNLLSKHSRKKSLKGQKVGYGNSFSFPPLVWLIHGVTSRGIKDIFNCISFIICAVFSLWICQVWNLEFHYLFVLFTWNSPNKNKALTANGLEACWVCLIPEIILNPNDNFKRLWDRKPRKAFSSFTLLLLKKQLIISNTKTNPYKLDRCFESDITTWIWSILVKWMTVESTPNKHWANCVWIKAAIRSDGSDLKCLFI